MTTSVQILIISLILSIITISISGLSLWINWKNYSKYTKIQLQTIIKQELKKSFEKIDYPFLNQENLQSLIDKNGNQDVFYQKYYQIFLKWQKWKKIKEWKPNYFDFNSFIRQYTQIEINGDQREIDLIESEGALLGHQWKNDKSSIFWQFYFALIKFLEIFFSIGFNTQDYEKGKLNVFSKILFSEKICKILNQIINYEYK